MTQTVKNEDDITQIIRSDAWMIKVLTAAEQLNLPDWWIGAGFLRNKIWDFIEGKASGPTKDVDLVYFNSQDTSPETDWAYDDKMAKEFPFAVWEVRNQARMHNVNGFDPFSSTADGIKHWVETATCVAVRKNGDVFEYLFCYGTDDLFGLVARPTPYFAAEPLLQRFVSRVEEKGWRGKWPNLRIYQH